MNYRTNDFHLLFYYYNFFLLPVFLNIYKNIFGKKESDGIFTV